MTPAVEPPSEDLWPLRLVLPILATLTVLGCVAVLLVFVTIGSDARPSAHTPPSPSANEPSSSQGPTPGLVAGGGIAVVPFVRDLERPLALAFAGEETDGIFIAGQNGVVTYVEDGRVQADPALDLSDQTLVGGELGMLGIALHPAFAENGLLYVSYVHTDESTILAEYSLPDRRRADLGSGRELLRLPQESAYHKGGALVFGPDDGLLYMSIGDDAWPTGDTPDYTDNFRGTIVRIDVDQSDGERPYGIPEDNPFAGGGGPPEVLDYGLRNPWRISIDAATGDLYIADVGSERFEEVSRHRADVPPPVDFGWGAWEGFECRRHQIRAELDCDDWADAEPPILVLEGGEFQSGDCAIIGGHVYRGEEVPALNGLYVFGDYCSGRLRTVPADRELPTPEIVLDTDIRMSSFGMDADGELYIADVDNGVVYRIVQD